MKDTMSPKKSLKKLSAIGPRAGRRTVGASDRPLVELGPLTASGDLPVVARPTTEGVDLNAWLKDHRDLVRRHQRRSGGVLFRGFGLATLDEFEGAVGDFSGEDPLPYRDATTPRSAVRGRVYTSTDYPADQTIFFHSELSYSKAWPMNLFFFSVTPAAEGGETPIADTRKILRQIDPEIRERFRERRVLYVRNYGGGLGLDWRDVFGTGDRDEIERLSAEAETEIEWRADDHLRTRTVRDAVATHPETGEEVWFNHVVLFHATSLDAEVRRTLVARWGELGLPHCTFYGDGEPIEPEVIEHLRQAYLDEAVVFPWQRGDLLLLDNMLTAHGRNPYKGERRLLTAMTELHHAGTAAR